MKLEVSMSLVLVCVCFVIANASDTTNVNVRELHTHALYINIPVDAEALRADLPAGIVPDEYNGTAWISVDVDTFAKLEKVVLGKYVNTLTGGYGFLKVNLLVTSASYGPGYFIHEMGFGNYLLTLGCKATQSFPCGSGSFKISTSRFPYSIDVRLSSGRRLHASFIDAGEPDTPFVSFVLGRKIKYALSGGKLIAVNQFPTSSSSSFPQKVQVVRLDSDADLGLLRLGEKLPDLLSGWSLCDAGTCFLQPSYTLIDHVAGNDVPSLSGGQNQFVV